MRVHTHIFIIGSIILSACSGSQYSMGETDDLYFSKEDAYAEENNPNAEVGDVSGEDYMSKEEYNNGYYNLDGKTPKGQDQNPRSESAYEEQQQGSYATEFTEGGTDGTTNITNNYYGDYYDESYTSQFRRFNSATVGMSYYDPFWYDPFFNYGYGYTYPYSGWSIGYSTYAGWAIGYNFGWGWPRYGYAGYCYDPWYCGIGYRYPFGWGNPYSYWNGYSDGYYNGFYDGIGVDYGIGNRRTYYNGHRSLANGGLNYKGGRANIETPNKVNEAMTNRTSINSPNAKTGTVDRSAVSRVNRSANGVVQARSDRATVARASNDRNIAAEKASAQYNTSGREKYNASATDRTKYNTGRLVTSQKPAQQYNQSRYVKSSEYQETRTDYNRSSRSRESYSSGERTKASPQRTTPNTSQPERVKVPVNSRSKQNPSYQQSPNREYDRGTTTPSRTRTTPQRSTIQRGSTPTRSYEAPRTRTSSPSMNRTTTPSRSSSPSRVSPSRSSISTPSRSSSAPSRSTSPSTTRGRR